MALDGLMNIPAYHMAVEKTDEPLVVFECSYGVVAARLRNRSRFEVLWQSPGREAECIAMSDKVHVDHEVAPPF